MLKPIAEAYAQSDFFGKLIFVALTLLSVASWVVFLYKMWQSYKLKQSQEQAKDLFKNFQKTPFHNQADRLHQQTGVIDPFSALYRLLKESTFTLLKKNRELKPKDQKNTFLSSSDIEQLFSQMDMKIYTEKKSMERYMFVLSTTFSLAPLLGLLGTVWGMSLALSQLHKTASAFNNDAVLSSLAMALGTTVYGIIVAVFALVFYNFLKGRIEDHTVSMNQFSSDLLHSVEVQYRAVDVL